MQFYLILLFVFLSLKLVKGVGLHVAGNKAAYDDNRAK